MSKQRRKKNYSDEVEGPRGRGRGEGDKYEKYKHRVYDELAGEEDEDLLDDEGWDVFGVDEAE